MDLKASRDTDEFGSVYSFDGLVNKIKKHNLVHPVSTSPTPPPTIPRRPPNQADFFAGHRGSVTGSNGAAVTGNGFRRFSVFSQPMPQYTPNGIYGHGVGGGFNNGAPGLGSIVANSKLDGLSEGKGSEYGTSSVCLDHPPPKLKKPRLSQDPDFRKVGTRILGSCYCIAT